MNTLIPLYREMAAGGQQFRGLSVLQHKVQIGKLIREHGAKTLLDYGCGAGDAYRSPHKVWKEWGLKWPDVTLFDPAFQQRRDDHIDLFRVFDLVICSDVLEHVPEDEVDAFVKKLFTHAKKVVWASFCARPAKKFFPDGVTNLHVTQRPLQWWHDTFTDHCGGKAFELVETP